jgi:hypothetical protein
MPDYQRTLPIAYCQLPIDFCLLTLVVSYIVVFY